MPDINRILNDLVGKATKDYTTNTAYGQSLSVRASDPGVNPTRYPTYYIGLDNEEIYGRNQSRASKWGNGLVKGLGLTATTFLQGTVGLVNGVVQAVGDGDFTSFFDNSFNKTLNDFSSGMEDNFANYYTAEEKNAAWYSPSTWATANFWSDTILKNMGFAAGAYFSGSVLTKGLTSAISGLSSAVGRATTGASKAISSASALEDASLLTNQGALLSRGVTGASELAQSGANQVAKNVWQNWAKNATHSVLSASGEASIEAYHAKNDYKEKLIESYRQSTGMDPDEKTLAEIDQTASSVGDMTFGINMALLTATNFVQFPLLSKSASGEMGVLTRGQRRAMYNVLDKEGNVISRSWGRGLNPVANTAKGETLQAVRTATGIGNQLERFGVGRVLNKVAPFARTIFSPSEAFEEGAQYLAPSFAEDYFDKGSSTKGDMIASFKKTFNDSLNEKDFWVSVLSGGLTGGLMENANPFNGNFFRPFKEKARSAQLSNEMVAAHNQNPISGYIADITQSFAREQILAEEATEAMMNGDRLEFEDKTTDSRLNYIIPRIQYGRGDLVQADINNWSQLAATDEGWQQIVENHNIPEGTTRQDFLKGLSKLQQTFNTTKTVFENLNLRYGGSLNENGQPTHNKDVLMKMAYVQAKIDDYNTRIPALSSELMNVGVSVTPLLDALSNKDGGEITLPNGETRTITKDNVEEVINSYYEYINDSIFAKDPSKTVDDRDDAIQKFSDIVQLAARRAVKVEEYKMMRDNPEAYQEDMYSTDFVPEDLSIDSDLDEGPSITPSVKSDFFQDHQTNPVTLDFGEMGQEQGYLRYNPKEDILAVERPDGSLYEVTNQDFKDGLVRFNDPNIKISDSFIDMVDPRTEVKKAETTRRIKEKMLEKQKELESSKRKVEELSDKTQRVKDRIQGSNPTASQELSDLEKEYDDLREKVRQSSLAKSTEDRFMQGELTEDEVNKILDDEFNRRGGQKLSDRINELRKTIIDDTLETYQKAGVTIQELQDIHSELQSELDKATEEQRVLENEYNVYQELLTTLNPDFNSTLNMVEEQLRLIKGLQNDLTSHQSHIQRLMNDVYTNIKMLGDMIKNKNNLSPSVHTNAINKSIDDFLSGRSGPEVLVGVLNGLDKKLILSKSQYDKLAKQLEEVQKGLTEVGNDIVARTKVYEELRKQSFKIDNPLDPSQFIELGVEETEEVSDEQEPSDSAVAQTRDRFNGTKKLLSRLFSSTILLPDDQQGQRWYKTYQRFIRTITSMPWEDRKNLRVKLITARTEEQAGIKGYIDYNTNNYYKNEQDKLDPSKGIIIAAVIKTKSDGTEYFIDADGNELGKVGEQLSSEKVENVVATRLALPRLTFLNSSEENYSKPEQVSVSPQELALGYTELRKEIMNNPNLDYTYSFNVSRGQLPTSDSQNQVVGTLIPSGNLSGRPLLRTIRNGETFTTSEGEERTLTKGAVLMLENEGALTPLYVGRQTNELALGLIKALEHTATNAQNSGSNTKSESNPALRDVERTDKDFANENESYRVIVGDEAFNDIIESGVVRTNADNKGTNKQKDVIDLGGRPTAYPSFSKGSASMSYAGENPNHYIIVTEDASIQPSTSGRHGKGKTMFPTDANGKHLKELDGSKVKVYKHIGDGKYDLVYSNGKAVESLLSKEQQTSTTQSESNPALSDVESTAKALKDKIKGLKEEKQKELNKVYPILELDDTLQDLNTVMEKYGISKSFEFIVQFFKNNNIRVSFDGKHMEGKLPKVASMDTAIINGKLSGIITINKNKFDKFDKKEQIEIIAHELVHGLIRFKLNEKGDLKGASFYKGLNSIFNEVKDFYYSGEKKTNKSNFNFLRKNFNEKELNDLGGMIRYIEDEIEEFATLGLTNPVFSKFLKLLEGKGETKQENLWTKLAKLIADFIGVSNTKFNELLNFVSAELNTNLNYSDEIKNKYDTQIIQKQKELESLLSKEQTPTQESNVVETPAPKGNTSNVGVEEGSGGVDAQMLNFIKATIPYGMKFNENDLTLVYKGTTYDLKNLDFAKELYSVFTSSKVRIDHPMMTPFTEILSDGSKRMWKTYQEYLLNNENNRKSLVYTNIAKKDLNHKYLILNGFYGQSQAEQVLREPPETEDATPQDPIQTLVDKTDVQDKSKLKTLITKLIDNPTLVNNILDANKQITEKDC